MLVDAHSSNQPLPHYAYEVLLIHCRSSPSRRCPPKKTAVETRSTYTNAAVVEVSGSHYRTSFVPFVAGHARRRLCREMSLVPVRPMHPCLQSLHQAATIIERG